VRQGERILRAVARETAADLERLLSASWFRRRVAAGSLPQSRWLAGPPAGWSARAAVPGTEFRWLEHEALRFPCYPHEITVSQLHEAAMLTLSLAQEALAEGWMLKDASAWNVLFDQGRPVFCDVLSFAPAGESGLWQAYAQFQRHFIIPLLMHRRVGARPSRFFLTHRDGVEPEDARMTLRGLSAWRQPALEAVTLPTIFKSRPGGPAAASPRGGARHSAAKPGNPELTRYLLARTFRRLQGHLERLRPGSPKIASKWANYELQRDHYSAADLQLKRAFVQAALAGADIETVLDLGCNTGEFSLLAESLGKLVVAADHDEQSLEKLLIRLRSGDSRIQTLLLDIGRPTPAVGWMNMEVAAVLARAAGRFDCIMMLGLIHHLLVSERATLERIAGLLESLGAHTLIIEWIERDDRRFRELAGVNAGLYEDLSRERFEAAITAQFTITAIQPLPGKTRTLYKCRRK
jgi:SAM-dependent methyltransferase